MEKTGAPCGCRLREPACHRLIPGHLWLAGTRRRRRQAMKRRPWEGEIRGHTSGTLRWWRTLEIPNDHHEAVPGPLAPSPPPRPPPALLLSPPVPPPARSQPNLRHAVHRVPPRWGADPWVEPPPARLATVRPSLRRIVGTRVPPKREAVLWTGRRSWMQPQLRWRWPQAAWLPTLRPSALRRTAHRVPPKWDTSSQQLAPPQPPRAAASLPATHG